MLIRLSQPASLFVQVDEVKEHAVIETSADDNLLEAYIRAATRLTEDRTGRTLLPTSLEWRTGVWHANICIPAFPVREITEIVYSDEDNVETILDADEYYLANTEDGVIIRFNDGFSSPELTDRRNKPIRVRFIAGYDDPEQSGSGDDPSLARDPMDEMIVKILVAHWYSIREPAITGTVIQDVPFSAQALIEMRRIYR